MHVRRWRRPILQGGFGTALHLPREAENRLIDPTYVSIKNYSKNNTCL